MRAGIGQHARDEGPETPSVLVRWPRRSGAYTYKRANAAACFKDAGSLEFRVDARDSIGVDAQLHGELTDRGQLLARLEAPDGDGGPKGALQLRIDWSPVAGVNRNHH